MSDHLRTFPRTQRSCENIYLGAYLKEKNLAKEDFEYGSTPSNLPLDIKQTTLNLHSLLTKL